MCSTAQNCDLEAQSHTLQSRAKQPQLASLSRTSTSAPPIPLTTGRPPAPLPHNLLHTPLNPPPRPAAADARLLRQYIDSLTGSGVDKSTQVLAATDNAEARALSLAPGFAHMEATIGALASYVFPGPQNKASTPDINQVIGEFPAAAFAPVAASATDQGAVAVAASSGMLLAQPRGTPGTARGSTLKTYDPPDMLGVGKSHRVMTLSAALSLPPAGSFSQSDRGDGPHAIASAGEAVASSFSSRFDVTNPTNGKLPWRR